MKLSEIIRGTGANLLHGTPGTEITAICSDSRQAAPGSIDPSDRAQIYNQLNRLYYGIYSTTDDVSFLQKVINALKQALSVHEAA